MISIQGLLGVGVVVLGGALVLPGCNRDECASAGDCSAPSTYTGYSGNVGAGGGNLTGDEPGQACVIDSDLCQWSPITASHDAASLSAICQNFKYDVATDCPTDGLTGCCATKTRIDCHYNKPLDAPTYMRQCDGQLGNWISTAP